MMAQKHCASPGKHSCQFDRCRLHQLLTDRPVFARRGNNEDVCERREDQGQQPNCGLGWRRDDQVRRIP